MTAKTDIHWLATLLTVVFGLSMADSESTQKSMEVTQHIAASLPVLLFVAITILDSGLISRRRRETIGFYGWFILTIIVFLAVGLTLLSVSHTVQYTNNNEVIVLSTYLTFYLTISLFLCLCFAAIKQSRGG